MDPPEIPPPERLRSAHLVGICGTGMQALAELLGGMGVTVTGSDRQPSNRHLRQMKRRGLRIHAGHRDNFLPRQADVLVYSPAVGSDNPERQSADRLGIPQVSFSRMLGHLMAEKTGISIAGTHGKSTTTAMLATILGDARLFPSAVIGAQLRGVQLSGWYGEGEHFVVESCEYQRNFLDLRPVHAAFLGIEPDHFDCFPDVDSIRAAFAEFAALLPAHGTLLVRGDCPHSMDAARSAPAEIITFSRQPGADWWGTDIKPTEFGTRFRVFHHGDFYAEISIRLPGEHNVTNALAAVAMADRLGVSVADVRESLAEFPGIARRFETVASWRGVTLVDDYAHHPTAVAATLKAARRRFGHRRLWCVFQPHQVSRTLALMKEFARSFCAADQILIAPVFAARETLTPPPSPSGRGEIGLPLPLGEGWGEGAEADVSRELTDRILLEGGAARYRPALDRITATLEDETLPGDVVITMGAGDIDRVHHELTRELQRDHPHG